MTGELPMPLPSPHHNHDWAAAGYQDVEYEMNGVSPQSHSSPTTPPPENQPMFYPPRSSARKPYLASKNSDSDLRRPSSSSSKSFHPSPLNPTPAPPIPRRFSSHTTTHLRQLPSEDSRVLSWAGGSPSPAASVSRGSMILYRFSDHEVPLAPPPLRRSSMFSSSGDSIISLSADSKYPLGGGGIVAYAYDPEDDEDEGPDYIHDPKIQDIGSHSIPWRGFLNVTMLIILLSAIISLFVAYPAVTFLRDDGRTARIVGNTKINSTGQAVDESVPVERRDQIRMESLPYRVSPEGVSYQLGFSDEFEDDDRDFASDSTWMTVGPFRGGIETRSGALVVKRNSTLGEDVLQLRTPLCLHDGFLEVGIISSDTKSHTRLFWNNDGWTSASLDDPTPPTNPTGRIDRLDIRISSHDPIATSVPDVRPVEILLDYIRLYQRSTATICATQGSTLHMYLMPHIAQYLSS